MTWASQGNAEPVELTGGSGVWFFSTGNERWFDMGSLSYQASLGHGHQGMINAISSQAQRLCLSMPNAVYPEKVALAQTLLNLAPQGFSKVFFTLGGAEANENALKIVKLASGRSKVISRYRSYHGATMGALELSGDYRRPPLGSNVVGVVHVLDTECALCPGNTRSAQCTHPPLSHIPRVMELEGGHTIAAVFLETVAGANGVIIPPAGYLSTVREACDRHGAFLVCDEVLTGFGRTGRTFAFEHFDGVSPDIIVLGKAITAGYAPLGAVLVHDRIAQHFENETLYCGLTQYAHPLGIAAALKAIECFQNDGINDHVRALEPVFKQALDGFVANYPNQVKRTRVIGLLAALDLAASPAQLKQLRVAFKHHRIHVHLRTDPGTLILAPPLCISQPELDQGLDLIEAAFRETFQ